MNTTRVYNTLSQAARDAVAYRKGAKAARKGLKRSEHRFTNPSRVKAFNKGYRETKRAMA